MSKDDIDGVYGIASFFTESDLKTLNAKFDYKLEAILQKVAELPNELFDAIGSNITLYLHQDPRYAFYRQRLSSSLQLQ